jgi:hypothetical protein
MHDDFFSPVERALIGYLVSKDVAGDVIAEVIHRTRNQLTASVCGRDDIDDALEELILEFEEWVDEFYLVSDSPLSIAVNQYFWDGGNLADVDLGKYEDCIISEPLPTKALILRDCLGGELATYRVFPNGTAEAVSLAV